MKKQPTINPNDFVSVESGSEDVYVPLNEEIDVYDVDKAIDEVNGVVVAGSTEDKVEYLDETKTDIREAIINKGVDVGEDDPFRLYAEKIGEIEGGEVHNQDKKITENGTYTADEGYTGLGKVVVDVPETEPVLEDITVQVNGVYTADEGYDGLGEVTVDVPQPVLETLNVSGNGTYVPSGNVDGYDEVVVDVQPVLEDISVSENGTYTASSGYDGLGEVVVNTPVINNQDKNINQNGTYTADSGYSGLGEVSVNVQPVLEDKTIRVNGTYIAGEGYDGLGEVVVDVADIPAVVEPLSVSPTTSQQIITPPVNVDGFNQVTVGAVDSSIDENIVSGNIKSGVSILGVSGSVVEVNNQNKTVSQNGVYVPDSGYTGFGEVTVNVPTTAPVLYREFQLDNTGKLIPNTTITHIMDFTGVTDVLDYALAYAYQNNTAISGAVDMSDLTTVSGMQACSFMFKGCTGMTSFDLSALTTVSGYGACQAMFSGCTGLINANLPALVTISGNLGCQGMFENCTGLISANLPALTMLRGNNACQYMFDGCTSLATVYIGGTTAIDFYSLFKNYFENMFLNCTQNIDVYAPAANQAKIESFSGYPNFGGTGTVTWHWRS